MSVYVESSAVLAWLLGEAAGADVRPVLRHAELVATSDLTIVECERAMLRGIALGTIDEAAAAELRGRLHRTAAHWHLWRVTAEILERARLPFPGEPIRTLDALHLASALVIRSVIPGIQLLSLDERVRRSGEQLGFQLQPV